MSFFASVAHVAQVLVNWFWVTIEGSWLHRGLARLLYLPSIVRMTLREGPNRRWYDRIDDTVILGALPFRSQTKEVRILNKVIRLVMVVLKTSASRKGEGASCALLQ